MGKSVHYSIDNIKTARSTVSVLAEVKSNSYTRTTFTKKLEQHMICQNIISSYIFIARFLMLCSTTESKNQMILYRNHTNLCIQLVILHELYKVFIISSDRGEIAFTVLPCPNGFRLTIVLSQSSETIEIKVRSDEARRSVFERIVFSVDKFKNCREIFKTYY